MCKVAGADVISASSIFNQRMEDKARINNDFGRKRSVGKEMPIRGQLKGALSLGDFHDSIQSGLLDEFDFGKRTEVAAALRDHFTGSFQVSKAGLGAPDLGPFRASLMPHVLCPSRS